VLAFYQFNTCVLLVVVAIGSAIVFGVLPDSDTDAG
jgi:hypothetical protein